MSTIHIAIAFIPVAVYLVLVGGLRLRRRPLITTGWRDTLALGVASIGLVAVGPMQLFFPTQAAARWQGWVWVALVVLYLLGLMMVLLSCKPRLVAYGLSEEQFRAALSEAAKTVDPQAHWNGNVLNLPGSNIQLASEPTHTARVNQVVHFGLLNNFGDWLKLERALVATGRGLTCPRSTAGWPLVLAGGLLLAITISPMLNDPAEAVAQLKEFINR